MTTLETSRRLPQGDSSIENFVDALAVAVSLEPGRAAITRVGGPVQWLIGDRDDVPDEVIVMPTTVTRGRAGGSLLPQTATSVRIRLSSDALLDLLSARLRWLQSVFLGRIVVSGSLPGLLYLTEFIPLAASLYRTSGGPVTGAPDDCAFFRGSSIDAVQALAARLPCPDTSADLQAAFVACMLFTLPLSERSSHLNAIRRRVDAEPHLQSSAEAVYAALERLGCEPFEPSAIDHTQTRGD